MTLPVTAAVTDGIGVLTLDRPAAFNALDLPTAEALRDAVGALGGARVVVLRAAGRAFCGGGDLAAFAAAPSLPAYVQQVAGALHEALLALWELDAVVVARVQGVAAGAGVALVGAADVVIASTAARFDLAYVRVGLTPDGGSSLLLPTLGLHRMLHLALLSPVLSAEQAHAAGLVAEVVAPDALDDRVEAVAGQLAAGPHHAQVAARALLRRRAVPDPAAALAAETAAIVAQAHGPDAAEGIAAFLAKRAARFA